MVPMRLMAGIFAGVCTITAAARGAVLVQYNFLNGGSTETLAQYETPTTSGANVNTNNFTVGLNTGTATNDGAAASSFYTSPGPNYLSVNNSLTSTNDDTNFYIDFVVNAAAGYTLSPTSFTIVGGRGGSSNVRSFLLFDGHDGLPTAITPTATTPTVTGGSQVGSTTAFTALRSSSAAMDTFTINFPAGDVNLSTFDVRVYFDTQANGQSKNIDLSSLTLNGDVNAVPEPASMGIFAAAVGAAALRRRRR